MKIPVNPTVCAKLPMATGVGLIAGLAGTIVMTACQRLDMKITGRSKNTAPADAVREVLDIKPVTGSESHQLSAWVHWVYGTSLGLVRGLVHLLGIRGLKAGVAHFGVVWGTELIMLPRLRVAPPLSRESPGTIARDALYHDLYTGSAGLVFDAVMEEAQAGQVREHFIIQSKKN